LLRGSDNDVLAAFGRLNALFRTGNLRFLWVVYPGKTPGQATALILGNSLISLLLPVIQSPIYRARARSIRDEGRPSGEE
jgi:hypothetical protein